MTKSYKVVAVGPAYNYPQCPYAYQRGLILKQSDDDLLLELEYSGKEIWIDIGRTYLTGEIVTR